VLAIAGIDQAGIGLPDRLVHCLVERGLAA
jgi:hypothetical protein